MLTVVTWASLASAGLVLIFAGYALRREMDLQKNAQDVVRAVAEKSGATGASVPAGPGQAGGLADRTQGHSLVAPDAVIKALAELAKEIGALRASVAALLIAFGLVIFAGIFASVADKVPDANTAFTTDTSTPAAQ
jgi:hypothetical protein